MEEFQKDIRFSLGEDFGHFVRGREWTNQHGHHCTAVVVRGVVEEIPVEWHFYLVAPEEGHRVSLALTMEEPDARRLGKTDQDLVDTLELVALEPTAPPTRSALGFFRRFVRASLTPFWPNSRLLLPSSANYINYLQI